MKTAAITPTRPIGLWPEVFGKDARLDEVSRILGTGYWRFTAPCGMDGLARVLTNGELQLLALYARQPNSGQLRAFLKLAKQSFTRIAVQEIWSPFLPEVLLRYGFTPFCDESEDETVSGMRWIAPSS